jgi:hypothetical protein
VCECVNSFVFHGQRRMDLLYAGNDQLGRTAAAAEELPGAYERLILEVLRGDQTNFVHADELIASWRIFTPALHELREKSVRPEPYVFGSAGPLSEATFAARFGFPNGFAHGLQDNETRRQAIAWGKSSVRSGGSGDSLGTTERSAADLSLSESVLEPLIVSSAAGER